MQRLLRAVPLLLVSLLAGCGGLTNSTSFREMSSAYRDVLEQYSNDNILLNIVRSSQSMPVSFLDMPSVMGSGAVSNQVQFGPTIYGVAPGSSVAGFFTPAAQSSYAAGVTLGVNNSFNFTQSSLDNGTFMKPFLSPIQPEIVGFLTANQAAPKSVLFTLVIESIDIVNENKEVMFSFVNDPGSSEYEKFQRALYILVAAGLTVEQVPLKIPMGPEMDEATMRASMGMFAAAIASGVTVDEINTPGRPKKYRLIRLMAQSKLCLNKTDGEVLFGQSLSPTMYCQQQFKSNVASRTATALSSLLQGSQDRTQKNLLVNIKLRSTRNVFDFLGEVVALQNAEKSTVVKMFNPDLLNAGPNVNLTDYPPVPLFVVRKNERLSNTFTSLSYRGDTYALPDDSQSFTKDVMVLLSQLLTLNKISGSIPPSPAVLVK
jgi:hypothetical protein